MQDGAGERWSRVVPLQGAGNFRDFGGYPTLDGSMVRRGLLYRSNRLSQLTAGDIARLDGLCIRTVFDLRARGERERDPTVWVGDRLTTHVFHPGHKRRLADMALDYPPNPEGAARLMHDFYRDLPRTIGHMVAEIIARIAQDDAPGVLPCLVHCSAGKDRTGVVAAMLLGALGVDRDLIVKDYVLTATLNATEEDMARSVVTSDTTDDFLARYSPETIAVMRAASHAYIQASFAAIDVDYGSIEGYFDAIGIEERTRWALRALLLEH